jgi:hypothetical protein
MAQTLTYRITGPQSIDRLKPLFAYLESGTNSWTEFCLHSTPSPIDQIDFIWETTVEKSFKRFHDGAKILNRLHNSVVSETCTLYAF